MLLSVPYFRQKKEYSCGPACLRMILMLHGLIRKPEELIALAGTTEQRGTRRDALVKTARGLGFRSQATGKGTWKDIQGHLKRGVPVIVEYREPVEDISHYAVVIGSRNGRVILNDPDNGERFSLPLNEFLNRWLGHRTRDPKWGWMMTIEPRMSSAQ